MFEEIFELQSADEEKTRRVRDERPLTSEEIAEVTAEIRF